LLLHAFVNTDPAYLTWKKYFMHEVQECSCS